MSDLPNKYHELRGDYKNYIDSYIALYQLKTKNEEEINSIYKKLKANLIDSYKFRPQKLLKDILNVIPYNNRYAKSYLALAKLVQNEFHIEEVTDIPIISNYLFFKEYGMKLDKSKDLEKMKSENLDIHAENTIYRAIMDNDKEKFIPFTQKQGFDKDQRLESKLYPNNDKGYTWLELCCYHGSINCFMHLRTKFNSEITETCLHLSFLGGNSEIVSECLKVQKPDEECVKNAIISHNIDFVAVLMNEYHKRVEVNECRIHNNLDAFLAYFVQTSDFNRCFIYSSMFNIPALCGYFLSNGANINEKDKYKETALHKAATNNSKESAELLIKNGANINEKNKYGETALHLAARNNSKETAELLLENGANVKEQYENGKTALHIAAYRNSKDTVEILISNGANINERYENGETALHIAAYKNSKDTAELLVTLGAEIDEKDEDGETPLHYAADNNSKETAELLLSLGATVDEKNEEGETALHKAAENNSKETAELLLTYGANVNEVNDDGETPYDKAEENNSEETAELLVSRGAKVHK